MTTAPSLTHVQTAYQSIGRAVEALREDYRAGCNNRNHLLRVGAQHQLTWLVPLYKALRAYLNNQCPGSRGAFSQGYYSYLEKYERVVDYLTSRVQVEGTARLHSELHPLVLSLVIPFPARDLKQLSVGMTVSAFVDALLQQIGAEKRSYHDASRRFLESLTPTQLTYLREMMRASQSMRWSRKGCVTFRMKDIQYR